jgi:hypothetical protein
MSKGYNSDFNNKWSMDHVKVDLNFTSASGGKKVFDWQFRVAGKSDRIPVEVKAFNDGTDVWFQAGSKYLPKGVRSTDINVLKSKVHEILTEQVTLLTKRRMGGLVRGRRHRWQFRFYRQPALGTGGKSQNPGKPAQAGRRPAIGQGADDHQRCGHGFSRTDRAGRGGRDDG